MMRALSITMLSVMLAGAAPIGVDQKTATSPQSRATTVRVSGFDEIQSWFQRLHQHQLWQHDAAVSEVAKLSPETLQTILEELGIVRQLLYDAGSKGIEEVRVFNRRLKTNQLAALMGFTDAELSMPGNVRHLARPDNPARVAIGRLMIRAAVLHTVIALSPKPRATRRRAASAMVAPFSVKAMRRAPGWMKASI